MSTPIRNRYDLAWQDDALCKEVDSNLFFPEPGGNTNDAVNICGRCDIKARCLAYALENDLREGIWGMTTPNQRKAMRRLYNDNGAAAA